MQRIKWIDYAKTFAIFGVVLLHTHSNPVATKCINGFIMPLFFIISGYLFSYENNPTYSKFVLKRFRQLVVPYLWISIIAYIAWLLFLRNYGNNPADSYDWFVPIIGSILGIPPLLVHDIPLWSLISFFMVEMAFYPINRKINNPIAISIFSFTISAVLYYIFYSPMLPLSIGPSIAGLSFYSIGFAYRKFSDTASLKIPLIYALIATVVFAISINNNSVISFYTCEYGNYLWFILSSLSGSIITIYISTLLSNFNIPKIIVFTSKSTLIICGFHLLAFALMKGVLLFILHIEPSEATNGLCRGIIFASASFITITLPIAFIIQKYFRWLVDK